MKLFTFLCVFCSIQFVIGSSKYWKCQSEINKYLYYNIKLNCTCFNECKETIYNTTDFMCNSINVRKDFITEITFENCDLTQINTFEIDKFLLLQYIYINVNSKIQQINRELFMNDSDVTYLGFRSYNITSINKNSFKHIQKLNRLILFNTFIKTIEDDTFAYLTELKYLKLFNNNLSSINERTFSGLINVKSLDLRKNNIHFIHKNAFNNLKQLTWLYLEFNSITHIESETFKHLTKLMELDLSQNALKTFNFDLISPMNETLKWLLLGENQLIELKISKDLQFSTLKYFNVTGNKFNCCKLQNFFNSTEGQALARKEESLFDNVFCDGNRHVDRNGNIPGLNCKEDLFNRKRSIENLIEIDTNCNGFPPKYVIYAMIGVGILIGMNVLAFYMCFKMLIERRKKCNLTNTN